MALILLGLGDSRPELEHCLGTAGFHPALAREAVAWAWQEFNGAEGIGLTDVARSA
jgi:hypothetical protein